MEVDKQPKTFGSQTPTGSYQYSGVESCKNHRDCQLFFPAFDLRSLIPHDEILDASSQKLSPVVKMPLPETKGLSYPKPTLTKTTTTTTKPVCLGSSAGGSCALLTRTGYKGGDASQQKNQDRIMMVSPLRDSVGRRYPMLLGLFDGHGDDGHVVSHHCALRFPQILHQQLGKVVQQQFGNEQEIRKAITNAYVEAERTLPPNNASGSTGIILLQVDHKLFVANTGDSLAFVASYQNGKARLLYRTKEHKPHLPEERQRIEAAGGTVHIPPAAQGAESSRVIVDVPDGLYIQLALAMSRSIGDLEASKAGVIVTPTIDVIDLSSQQNLFAVAASDGVLDRIDPTAVAQHLGQTLFGGGGDRSGDRLLGACEQIIMKASELWLKLGLQYRDDISIAVTRLV